MKKPTLHELEVINQMDPVDFENMLHELFTEFMLRAYINHGECTKEDIAFWIEELAYFYDQPGINELFRYNADEIERVIQAKAKEQVQELEH